MLIQEINLLSVLSQHPVLLLLLYDLLHLTEFITTIEFFFCFLQNFKKLHFKKPCPVLKQSRFTNGKTMPSSKSFSFGCNSASLLIRLTKQKHPSNNTVQKERRKHHYCYFIYHFTAGQHRNPNQVKTSLCQVLYTINSSSCFRKHEICAHIYSQVCGPMVTHVVITSTNAGVGTQKCWLQDTNTLWFPPG